jgi:hypothetical protein
MRSVGAATGTRREACSAAISNVVLTGSTSLRDCIKNTLQVLPVPYPTG